MSDSLILKFDPNTIEHLGVSLYSQLPSVLSKLVSNSWDAGADNVTIDFIPSDLSKEIDCQDDGEGMTFGELLKQAYDYGSFLKNKYASETGFSRVICYVEGGEKNTSDYKFKDREDTYIKTGEVFVKTYRELLEQSKEYHKEFIETYDTYNN